MVNPFNYIFKFFKCSCSGFEYLRGDGSELFTLSKGNPFMLFVYSGELTVSYEDEHVSLQKGEYLFVKKDITVNISKSDSEEEKFCTVFFSFEKMFLLDFYKNLDIKYIHTSLAKPEKNIIKLPYNPYLQSIYISIGSYLEYGVKPTSDIINIKMQESVYALMLTDIRFFSCLFDFVHLMNYNNNNHLHKN